MGAWIGGCTSTFLRYVSIDTAQTLSNLDVVQKSLMSTVREKGYQPGRWLFQQDNDSKHTAHATRDWLHANKITTISWPPDSPDLNCIENAWAELERRVTQRNPRPVTEDQLWAALQYEWYSPSFDRYVKRLYASIPHRIQSLLDSQGWWTKY